MPAEENKDGGIDCVKAMIAAAVGALLLAHFSIAPLSHAGILQLTNPHKSPNQPFEADALANPAGNVILQGSTNLADWVDLQTIVMDGSLTHFTDPTSANHPLRFYRLVRRSSGPSLLQSAVNSVFIPNEGFNVIQAKADGRFALILWEGRELVYWNETSAGWNREIICACGDVYEPKLLDAARFQPLSVLLLDSQGDPHVFVVIGHTSRHYIRLSPSNWSASESIAVPGSREPTLFAADIGPGNSFHFAVAQPGDSPLVRYGTNKSGDWDWEIVALLNDSPRGFLKQSYSPRFFSLAVDSANWGHITFTREFRETWGDRGAMLHSALSYASNRLLGVWIVETVIAPDDSSGDTALGACVEIGPDDQPAVVSFYNERAGTGSSQWSQLFYHERALPGLWSREVIARYPDGYVAGDGIKGTGFAPYLRFDSRGRPHVVFSDHASEHFEASGQNEFAGQIRHARRDGATWIVETIFRQSDPLEEQMLYPAFAITPQRIGFLGLEWRTEWAVNAWPRQVESEFRLIWLDTSQ